MAEERHARLAEIVDHGGDRRSLGFALERPLAFLPGQFVSCLLPRDGARVTRAYSIASDPEAPDRITLLLDRVPDGPGSGALFAMSPGDPLTFTGPWGGFTLDHAPDAEAVFVALHTGIAAIAPMLRRASRQARHPLRLLYATTQPLWADQLGALPHVTCDVVTPDTVADVVRHRYVDADADRTRRVWICGVGPLVHELRDTLRAAGYERRAVQYEKW
jgi:ferredoxin-NADP reductase